VTARTYLGLVKEGCGGGVLGRKCVFEGSVGRDPYRRGGIEGTVVLRTRDEEGEGRSSL